MGSADLRRGRIGSFHSFKWRLAMALQADAGVGIPLDDIWQAWERLGGASLAPAHGWTEDALSTIRLYAGQKARFAFSTLAQARAAFAGVFVETGIHVPGYELGERCPILVLRLRGGTA